MKDIAQELGVSIPLVSKVLNASSGTAGASEETARKIRETAGRLGYRRNRAAAALITGRQGAIGVMLHKAGAPGSNQVDAIISGLSEAANKIDLLQHLMLYQQDDEFRKALPKMNSANVDGLIVAGILHHGLAEDLQAFQAAEAPVVTMFEDPIHADLVNVGCDRMSQGRMAIEHLLSRGCRNIAQIHGWKERANGCRQALAAAGVSTDPSIIIDSVGGQVTAEDGEAFANRLLASGVEFDGLFCACDTLAAGAIRAILKVGRNVGTDLRIIGVDNAPICECAAVPISSIDIRLQDRATEAVKLLASRLAGEDVASADLEPILVPRASSMG